MRISGFGIYGYAVFSLIGCDLAVAVGIFRKVDRGVVFDRNDFAFIHRRKRICESVCAHTARVSRGVAGYHHCRVDDKRVAEHGICYDYVFNVTGRGHGNGVVERTGGLVINGGFFRESLTGIRIFEYYIALDILGPAYLACFSVKLGVESVSEAYVRGVDKSRIVGVILIERYAQHAVRAQIITRVDLIGPAFVNDINLQQTGLLVVDHDTFGYLIRERCVIGKLTCRIFCK